MTKGDLLEILKPYTDEIDVVVDHNPHSDFRESIQSVNYDMVNDGTGRLSICTYEEHQVNPDGSKTRLK